MIKRKGYALFKVGGGDLCIKDCTDGTAVLDRTEIPMLIEDLVSIEVSKDSGPTPATHFEDL